MPTKQFFNLADNECQFWRSFLYKDKEYCFEHLNSRKLSFTHPQRDESYTLYITISHHVFTTELAKTPKYTQAQIYPYKRSDLRVFSEKRYDLSFHLPQILATLPQQFCYHGGYSRYCICKLNDGNKEIFYQLVFRVWKSHKKIRFHIESAYPLSSRPGKTKKIKKVNFWVICFNLQHGKKLPSPAR